MTEPVPPVTLRIGAMPPVVLLRVCAVRPIAISGPFARFVPASVRPLTVNRRGVPTPIGVLSI